MSPQRFRRAGKGKYMKLKDIAQQNGFDENDFSSFMRRSRIIAFEGLSMSSIADSDVPRAINLYKETLPEKEKIEAEARQAKQEEELARIAEVQAAIESSKVLLSTCPSVEGYHITKHLGLVFGECAYKTGFFKSLSASFDNIADILSVGDRELSGTARILEKAREYAINKMIEAASQRGANAVIGVDSESSLGGAVMHITIYGTAVVIEEIAKQE